MFTDKKFFEINREERNYGFLLLSSLIYEENFRREFLAILKKKSHHLSEIIEISAPIDIYAEVALFRDYWFDFGDQKNYTPELHQSRLTTISEILESFSINSNIIENNDLFWTGKIGESKLWYPGRWEIAKIHKVQKQENLINNELLRIRWASNAKPDILITSNNWAAFIELKIESGIGENQYGYNQRKTLLDIITIAKKTIPSFHNLHIDSFIISKNKPNSIKWTDFIEAIGHDLVKKYMKYIPQ